MAVSSAVIKAIATAATDKRTWKALAILLAAIFMPLILLILMIAGMVLWVESANKRSACLRMSSARNMVQLFSQPHEIMPEEVKMDMRIDLIGF